MSLPSKEFHLCVMGASNVGKTGLCERLIGKAFARKPARPSIEDEATRYSIEVQTSVGLLLIHLYDWAWEVKRRDVSINQQIMRGNDGGVFVYDVTDKRTLRDFPEHCDWYQRAAGFDKPWLVVSNKNDQKKRVVTDQEGQAVARAGDRRIYAAVSLVDDTGIEDTVLGLSRLMMNDLNLTMVSFLPASEESLSWSDGKAAAVTASIGLTSARKVLLIVLNRSIADKFSETLIGSEFCLEAVGSMDECEEELAKGNSSPPIVAIAVPHSAPESQHRAIKELATRFAVKGLITIPKDILTALREE